MMGVRNWYEVVNWTTDGSSLTTLNKYIYKGHDHASVAVIDGNKAGGDVVRSSIIEMLGG
jgi:hypothetical protein